MKTSIRSFAIITLASISFTLLPNAQAVVPAPDGGYPGGNTAEGSQALFSLTSGVSNTANGHQALFNNTIGNSNTALGFRALFNNTTGVQNTATGFNTLFHNTAGEANTADGREALSNNTTGDDNTANGFQALFTNTIGNQNTANGVSALFRNTNGSWNTATGFRALFNNTSGIFNTAAGYEALFKNTNGDINTAIGQSALYNNTEGSLNAANGSSALYNNTTGNQNTANGLSALHDNTFGNNNTALGFFALPNNTFGNRNIAVGARAGFGVTTADNVICIGTDLAGANVSNSCYIGNIFGQTSTGGIVRITSDGKLGMATSSKRFKEEIEPMEKSSEDILSLKPVTFRYKTDLDPERTRQFGLVAEDVEKVNPDLVVRDKEGKPYTVRYDAVNAMLLNEFLKEHRKVEQLQATATQQANEIKDLKVSLKRQAAQIQKVSAQFEMAKPAAKVARSGQ